MEQENMSVETPKTFDEMLSTNDYQSEFDKRVAKALDTAKAKWETDYKTKLENEKTEAQKLAKMDTEQKLNYQLEQSVKEAEQARAELNTYKLKDQATKIANEKGLPIGYLELIDFSKANADDLSATIDNLIQVRSNDLENYIKEKVKETAPKTVASGSTVTKSIPLIF